MAKTHVIAKKLGYAVSKTEGAYWIDVEKYATAWVHAPACHKNRSIGPFKTRHQANVAAVMHYWSVVHDNPRMQQLLWTPN